MFFLVLCGTYYVCQFKLFHLFYSASLGNVQITASKQGAESTISFSLMVYEFQLPLSFLLFPNNATFSFHIESIVNK